MANSKRKALPGLLLFALSAIFLEGKAKAGECHFFVNYTEQKKLRSPSLWFGFCTNAHVRLEDLRIVDVHVRIKSDDSQGGCLRKKTCTCCFELCNFDHANLIQLSSVVRSCCIIGFSLFFLVLLKIPAGLWISFTISPEKLWKGHVIRTISARDCELCKIQCLWERRCVSYNYRGVSCELNSADHIEHPDDLKDEEGSDYHAAEVSGYSGGEC